MQKGELTSVQVPPKQFELRQFERSGESRFDDRRMFYGGSRELQLPEIRPVYAAFRPGATKMLV
jgi:hypothetical protein